MLKGTMRQSTTPQPTGPESLSSSRVSKLARRPHRKSRNGCFNCKRRKVKCDEVKPACANCVRFGIPCDFAPQPLSSDDSAHQRSPPEILSVLAEPAATPRRGPGRPRKDWAALTRPPPPPPASASDRATTSPSSTSATPASSSTISNSQICSLNVADAELLFHFMANTSRTLHDTDDSTDDIASFWAKNVPQIGLSYHFVLHMMYALAGYHLVYQEPKGTERHSQNLALAAHHAEIGISEMNRTITNLNETNCGALYVAAVLVCYCTFAAGPTGPDDLLVCVVGDGISQRWLPVIHGVRLIRQSIEPATLFTGLMAPFGEGGAKPELEDPRPEYLVKGFSHLDWIEPLERLRVWIASHDNPDTALYLRVHKSLCDVYEANYGNLKGVIEVPISNKLVFGWLYRMQDLFVGCLQRKAPQALLLLAYYVPLFKTMKQCWYLDGWAAHLLDRIRGLLSAELLGWLDWPVGMSLQPEVI
ncbi:unnamed protein product [Fusarium venenatum]|uniref:Zn(2)-C6 fungal-type domain-containing protein n=1 Tax=Fusarium venenatum TaxID=56646 RepID=A0A2L2TYB5_9HYPO|nr:uncharacterized protein FVRRES_09953 [Fusarium venenatum]CEI69876.1 unnamed protein product [Fusarium venenatum]